MRALARYQLYVVDKVGLGGRWARRDLLEEAATRVTNRDTMKSLLECLCLRSAPPTHSVVLRSPFCDHHTPICALLLY